MRVCFVTNFMNHHQIGLCDTLSRQFGVGNFHVVVREELPDEKKKLGYLDFEKSRDYIVCEYCEPAKTRALIMEADAIIVTFSEGLKPIAPAVKAHKIIFWYGERLFKDYNVIKSFAKYLRALYYFKRYPNDHLYFLNASSYGEKDLMKIDRSYGQRSFRFGYFPVFDQLSNEPKSFSSDRLSLIFVGRLIPWKHPDFMFRCAETLEKHGIPFHITIVGDGEMKNDMQAYVASHTFQHGDILLQGSVSAAEVSTFYSQADVMVFPSDRREGWGAVLNEGMFNGCICLANQEAGATNFLIQDGISGFSYQNENEAIAKLLNIQRLKKENALAKISSQARATILDLWNYQVAGERLAQVIQKVYAKENVAGLYLTGPLSK